MSDRILEGYVREKQFADELDVTTRTTRKYRSRETDGLPYVVVGKQVLIPVAEGRDWVRRQIRGGRR